MNSDTTVVMLVIAVLIGILLIGPLATLIIWNWVMPSLGFMSIAFWQACGLYWLCTLLFKSYNHTSNK